MEGVNLELQSFLMSVLDGDKWSFRLVVQLVAWSHIHDIDQTTYFYIRLIKYSTILRQYVYSPLTQGHQHYSHIAVVMEDKLIILP